MEGEKRRSDCKISWGETTCIKINEAGKGGTQWEEFCDMFCSEAEAEERGSTPWNRQPALYDEKWAVGVRHVHPIMKVRERAASHETETSRRLHGLPRQQ